MLFTGKVDCVQLKKKKVIFFCFRLSYGQNLTPPWAKSGPGCSVDLKLKGFYVYSACVFFVRAPSGSERRGGGQGAVLISVQRGPLPGRTPHHHGAGRRWAVFSLSGTALCQSVTLRGRGKVHFKRLALMPKAQHAAGLCFSSCALFDKALDKWWQLYITRWRTSRVVIDSTAKHDYKELWPTNTWTFDCCRAD